MKLWDLTGKGKSHKKGMVVYKLYENPLHPNLWNRAILKEAQPFFDT